MLIRKKLTEDEFSNPALRYDETCDCIQFSPDGGTTWIDQPANDPRSSDAYRLPALTGSNTRCRAAEGMTALIRACVDARLDFISDAGLAGAILGIVTFIPGFNVLWALILAFVGFAVTIAAEILEAAFTETVYDEIRCIFFCNISENGQMNAEQFVAAYDDLINLDTIPRTWVQAVMNMVGAVGMSNAGVALEAAADCDACDECGWCYLFNFSSSDGAWFPRAANEGVYVVDSGWSANCLTTSQRVVIQFNFAAATDIDRFTCLFDYVAGTWTPPPADGRRIIMRVFSAVNGGGSVLASSTSSILSTGNNLVAGVTFGASVAARSLEVNIWTSQNNCSGSALIKQITIGNDAGDNPIGESNC